MAAWRVRHKRVVLVALTMCWMLCWAALTITLRRQPQLQHEGCKGLVCQVSGVTVMAYVALCHPVSVYLWESTRATAWRLKYLLQEGVDDHPFVKWAPSVEQADVILYIPPSADPPLHDKVLVLDERDSTAVDGLLKKFDIVFKRSFIKRRDGVHYGTVDRRAIPFHYAMSNSYVFPELERTLDIVCTLRVGRGEYPLRGRVLNWTRSAMLELGANGFAAELNSGSRTSLSEPYFKLMKRAKIIVTANPGDWCGDFRTFEALTTGALVVIDSMCPPIPFGLSDKQHVALFDPTPGHYEAFRDTLRFYLTNPGKRRAIAVNGLVRALTYHRAVSRLDWILFTALELGHSHNSSHLAACSSTKYNQARAFVHEVDPRRAGRGDTAHPAVVQPPAPLDKAQVQRLRGPFDLSEIRSRFSDISLNLPPRQRD